MGSRLTYVLSAWFIAAILPLPEKPASFDPHAGSDPMERGRGNDVYLRTNPGALAAMELEERRYQKARWWRTLNRFMCFAGLAIVGAVVSLIRLGRDGTQLTSNRLHWS